MVYTLMRHAETEPFFGADSVFRIWDNSRLLVWQSLDEARCELSKLIEEFPETWRHYAVYGVHAEWSAIPECSEPIDRRRLFAAASISRLPIAQGGTGFFR